MIESPEHCSAKSNEDEFMMAITSDLSRVDTLRVWRQIVSILEVAALYNHFTIISNDLISDYTINIVPSKLLVAFFLSCSNLSV